MLSELIMNSTYKVKVMSKMLPTYVAAMSLLLFHSLTWAGMRDDEVAAVKVYKEVSASQVVYTYAVTNKGDCPIIGLTVGFDHYRGHTELTGSHPRQLSTPNQWSGRVVTLEESDQYEVSWDIDAPSAAILPGQTIAGFQIIAAQDSSLFTTSNWTVIVDGPPVNASSRLQFVQGPAPNIDTIPPQLTASLTPNVVWPPNRRMDNIVANITVRDDRDQTPKVKLVSITCNECESGAEDITGAAVGTDDRAFAVRAERIGKRKEGRVYTVTYSATDAAGNVSQAQAKVTIPHDQRK
jgi:hypothetical protein